MAEVAAPRLPLDEDAGPPGADAQEPEEREHAAAPAEAESDDKRSAAAEADEKPTPSRCVHIPNRKMANADLPRSLAPNPARPPANRPRPST